MKAGLPMLALSLVCCAATAYCAATAENRAKALAELTGESSMFFDEHAADFMWDGLDEMTRRFGLSKEELASVLAEAALQTIGQTNLLSQYVRRGAVEALGRYGTRRELPALERLALRNDVFAAPAACRVYSEIATMDEYLALVGRIFDGEGEWEPREKGVVSTHFYHLLRGNDEHCKAKLVEFLRHRVSVETNASNMARFDRHLSSVDMKYAESRARQLNILRVMEADKNIDPGTRDRLNSAVKAAAKPTRQGEKGDGGDLSE